MRDLKGNNDRQLGWRIFQLPTGTFAKDVLVSKGYADIVRWMAG
jgi:hypothetical protein